MFDDKETLADLLAQCHEKILADYGLNLLSICDLHTGAPIGFFNESVFHTALIDEGVLDDSENGEVLAIEDLADALLVRSLASARPSPALNRPTTQSLKRLMESHPKIVCAYLLNRYRLVDWRKLSHRDDSWFDDMLHRVKVWNKLSDLDDGSDPYESALRALCHWLLELDSKANLHMLTPVAGWFETFLGLETTEQFELFVAEFAIIATPTIVEADRLLSIGNRMTSSAYVKSWFDNPILNERKVEIAGRIKGKSRQALHDKYGDAELGALLEAERLEVAIKNGAKKTMLDGRIIKGRSSRSKAAKLVNKHAAKLDSLFRTLTEVTAADGFRPELTPKPVKTMGLPKFVKAS